MHVAKSTAKGTRFETALVKHFTEFGYPLARMEKAGASDKGDLRGLFFEGDPIVVEAKVRAKASSFTIGPWLGEVAAAKNNLDAPAGLLIIKRPGTTDTARSWVVLTKDDVERLRFPVEFSDDCVRVPPGSWATSYDGQPMVTKLIDSTPIVVMSLDDLLASVMFDKRNANLDEVFDAVEAMTGARPSDDISASSLFRIVADTDHELVIEKK